MNILFFLTPKNEVSYVYDDFSLRQTLEVMEYHKYASIPMISRSGRYIGCITEGDLLWGIKEINGLNLKAAEHMKITELERRMDYSVVSAESKMEDLVGKAMDQNFVPVVDDQGNFIGIITRRSIIEYCYKKLRTCDKDF